MIDYTRAFHTGVLTDNLDAAIEFYGRTLGLRFAEPYQLDELSLWTPELGLHHVRNRFTYSIDGPMHLELQGGTPGSFYDPTLSRGDHVGIWVSDLPASVGALLNDGWGVIAAGAAPDEGYGKFTYLRPQAGGMVVELVSDSLEEVFARWFRGESLAV